MRLWLPGRLVCTLTRFALPITGAKHDELGADTLFSGRLCREPTASPQTLADHRPLFPQKRPFIITSTAPISLAEPSLPNHTPYPLSCSDFALTSGDPPQLFAHLPSRSEFILLSRPLLVHHVCRAHTIPISGKHCGTAVIFKMKARGRAQSGDHVIFKATYSGVPVYEFMCKGYLPLRQLPGNSPVGGDRSSALSSD